MSMLTGVACVFCAIGAVTPPFDTASRVNVVLAVINGLLFIAYTRRGA